MYVFAKISSVQFIYNRYIVFVQLMATGESGVSGVHVLSRANKESNQEHVNVIHLLLSTVERIVMESQRKLKYATKKFLAQVSWDLYPFL